MPEFKLMVSYNCGTSYCFEMATKDRQDPELLKKIEEVSKKGLRFYIEGDETYLCPTHETILRLVHATPKGFIENNYYTLYWRNGDRNVINGKTIEEAFTTAGYGAGAIHALDWYDEGVTETHYYNKQNANWIKYEPIHLHFNDVKWSDPSLAAELTALLNKHHTLIVEFENKDQYSISFNYGNYYSTGWVKALTITYGEYYEGSYTEDGDEDHHFMMTQSEYFDPNNISAAIAAFIERSDCPYRASNSKEAKCVDQLPRL